MPPAPHAPLHHHLVAAEMGEGSFHDGRIGRFGPQCRDGRGAALRQLAQIELVGIPAHHFARIGNDHSGGLKLAKPGEELVLRLDVIPGRAEQRDVECPQLGQRCAPVDRLHFGASGQTPDQRGELEIVFEGIGAAGGRTGQGFGAGKEGDAQWMLRGGSGF